MRAHSSDAGFSMMELLFATAISLLVIGAAMTTFKDATGMTSTASNLADASLNLRGGTNLLLRDLALTGGHIPTGGIPIPTTGATAINRPSPPNAAYTFNNTTATTITALTTGSSLGPTVDGDPTDMVTMLTLDMLLEQVLAPANSAPGTTHTLSMWIPKSGKSAPAGSDGSMAADGSSMTVNTASAKWIAGDPTNGVAPLIKGDLLMFGNASGQYALQTVTATTSTTVTFAAQSTNDPFNLNQRTATAGSITQILVANTSLTVQRVLMYTYYVDQNNGTPRLMRRYNFNTPQALAGVVEDLQLTYDIVDGVLNPTAVDDLPYTLNGTTYTANQIRKVNVHIGVRSEMMTMNKKDYMRNHISTVVSLRQLAYVDRYQ